MLRPIDLAFTIDIVDASIAEAAARGDGAGLLELRRKLQAVSCDRRPRRPGAKSNAPGSNSSESSGVRQSESCSFLPSRLPSLPIFMVALMTNVPMRIAIDVLEMIITIIEV